MLVAILLLLGSIIVYAAIGSSDYVSEGHAGTSPQKRTTPSTTGDPRNPAGSVASLLGGLEERLAREPEDAKGWLLLAKSYDHLGRHADAKAAYEKAAGLGLTDEVLAKSLAYESATTDQDGKVSGRITVASGVAAHIDPTDTVFVVARSTDGNPMPIAVLRRPAADLPFEFTLDDSASMRMGHGISQADTVNIDVKLSRSGDALHTTESLGASIRNISVGEGTVVELVISRIETNE